MGIGQRGQRSSKGKGKGKQGKLGKERDGVRQGNTQTGNETVTMQNGRQIQAGLINSRVFIIPDYA